MKNLTVLCFQSSFRSLRGYVPYMQVSSDQNNFSVTHLAFLDLCPPLSDDLAGGSAVLFPPLLDTCGAGVLGRVLASDSSELVEVELDPEDEIETERLRRAMVWESE
jgi:hypothetical protein